MEDEEVDEREQRGADDERRHGRRQPAAAALAERRRQQRRGGLRVLVPLHAVLLVVGPGQWHLLCSAPLRSSAPQRSAAASRSRVVSGGSGEVAMQLLPALKAARNKLKLPRASRVSGTNQPAATRRYTPGISGVETGLESGRLVGTGNWEGRRG